MAIPHTLSLAAARAVALHTQQLTTPNGAEPTPDLATIYALADALLYVQIDTLHMVHRAQYVTLWSRLGAYDIADFDRLIYDPAERRLFEYWGHAASIIPLTEYRHKLGHMQGFGRYDGWRHGWIQDPDNQAAVAAVLDRIEAEGGLRAADFKEDKGRGGSWWNWKPAKLALEFLYNRGDVMIGDRVNFQRVYELRERVLPEWVDNTLPDETETRRHMLERGARALGVGEIRDLADYHHWKRGELGPLVAELVEAGMLIEVQVEQADGAARPMLVHQANAALLEQAADGALVPARTTFLNPFDSVIWSKERVWQLWQFRQSLEAYKRAEDRIWGYYCLPILRGDRLIGRFDPKLERKTGTLRLKALYLEPEIDPSADLIADVAGAMRDFLAWHGATDLVIERSDPAEFGSKLLAAL